MGREINQEMTQKEVRERTIQDFGNQWQIHGQVDQDYWSSKEMFTDHFGELFDPQEIAGKVVAEVGSGSGRIINMICDFEPAKCHAIEPSAGFDVLKSNTARNSDIIEYWNCTGDSFELQDLDLVFSLGVIHHIQNPTDVVKNIHRSLKEDGAFLIWVYGYEGNKSYIFIYNLLAGVTKRLPDSWLDGFSALLNYLIQPYIWACKILPLPLRGYLLNVFNKCGWEKRKYIIFDQLNPAYAKYYKREELQALLNAAGFSDVEFYHRHGYSWTAIARKSSARPGAVDDAGASSE